MATLKHRKLSLITALGTDALLVRTLSVREELARPFLIQVEALSTDFNLDLNAAIGKDATIRITSYTDQPRFFNGVVTKCTFKGQQGRYAAYELVIRPAFWLLSRTNDCRIFQNQTVPEIAKVMLGEHRLGDTEHALSEQYAPSEFCVQYRESDFAFLSRLFEHEGISYFFEHANGSHRMVLADTPGAFQPAPGAATIRYHASDDTAARERVRSWRVSQELQTGKVALTDYDFAAPRKRLLQQSAMPRPHARADFEIFDFPGKYVDNEVGERLARIRLQELQCRHEVIEAEGDVVGIAVGHVFTLIDHPRHDQNRRYVVIESEHIATSDAFESATSGSEDQYTVRFRAIPADTYFRPLRLTPRPLIPGPQTAVVVGEKGLEIDTDDHSRVKVQFHWDRYGKFDEKSSCWIRVNQPWAGQGWGGIQIPRIGQEVIVDFLEGDPDRPVITGRMYNGEQKPVVSAAGRDAAKGEVNPANPREAAMQMTLRSNSLGGSGGHNEITMHDAGGAEKLFIRDQKDEVHLVQNDRKDTVLNDETREVVKNRKRKVGENETVSIGIDESRDIGSNQTIKVGKNIKISAGDSITLECGLSKLTMNSAGVISLSGTMITIAGMANVNVAAPITNVAGGVMLNLAAPIVMTQGMLVRTGASSSFIVNASEIEMKADGENRVKGVPIKFNG